jgi:cytochrome c biogenesis protein CcmG, thiol:disulfide interchange protein DsbE
MPAMTSTARRTLSALAVIAMAACATGRPTLVASPLVGKPLDLSAPELAGREVRLGDAKGKVRVVDFWATWCDPCRDQLPVLETLARAHAAEGLQVYAVAVDEDRAQLEAFLATFPLAVTVLWDKGGARHTERLDVQRLPTTLVVDRAGLVRFVHQGYDPSNADQLAREVRRLLAEPEP